MAETNVNSLTAPLPDENSPAVPALAWGLFWRMFFAQAAPLFLAAAVVCFFAFNWAGMPAFAKFGLIGLLMLGSAALALWRGIESTVGSLGLLACGLFAGPLLAVFGQVYQTGADPWELFRAWSLFLLPLALVGRQNGLWLALWVAGSLWAGLYLNDLADFSSYHWERTPYPLYLALMQAAAMVAREAAAFTLAGPERPFLRARWVPRVMVFPLMTFLTCMTASHMLAPREMHHGSGYMLLLLFLLICGGVFYTQKKRDTVMIAYGLMSLISLAAMLPLIDIDAYDSLIGRAFLVALILLGGAAASVKILVAYHKQVLPPASPPKDGANEEEQPRQDAAPRPGAENAASAGTLSEVAVRQLSLSSAYAPRLMRFALTGTLPAEKNVPDAAPSGSSPWVAKLLAGVCAWIAAPFLMAFIGLLLGGRLDTNGFIFLLILVMAAGAGISRLEGGVFKQQTALCLALTGALGAGGLFAFEHHSAFPYALLLALFAIGYPAVNNALYRFFAAAVGLPVLVLTVLADPRGNFLQSSHYYAQSELPFMHPVIPAVFFSLLCVGLAHLKTPAPSGQKSGTFDGPLWRPLFTGWLTALLLMGAATLARFFPSFWMIGLGAGVGLAYFSFRLSGQLGLPLFSRVVLIGLSAAVAAVSFRLPWFGAGLFALAMARQMGSLPFAGLAVIHLAVCVNLEYYNLGATLLHKSLSLAVIGLLLLAAAFVLHGLLRSAIRQGRLPDPLSLLAGRAQSADAARPSSTISGRIRIPRKSIVAVCILAFFLLFSWSVLQKERLLAAGDSVILALRPVDPRSLMQGDYMILRFAVEDEIRHALRENSFGERAWTKSTAVMETGPDNVFRFKRMDDGSPLAAGEKRLVFRSGDDRVQVSSGAFFFQEGYGQAYGKARFALLRVDEAGNGLITRLLDEQKNVIQPEKNPEEKPEQ